MNSSARGSWIKWYCNLRGNDFFCEVDLDYIMDMFNLQGLNEQVSHYKQAMNLILDVQDPNRGNCDELALIMEKSSEILYGLIHARFILTARGIEKMLIKFEAGVFGSCPRVHCDSYPMLPIGLSDVIGETMVKLYCPKCKEVYTPESPRYWNTDGAYFGTGFPHMVFMMHPQLRPKRPAARYVPRLYGFKVHPLAYDMQYRLSSISYQASGCWEIRREEPADGSPDEPMADKSPKSPNSTK